MSHSPEPWTFGNDFADYGAIVDCGDDCEYIYGSTNLNRQFSKIPVDEQWANARRIVACVNACRGIPTERLLTLDLKAVVELAESHNPSNIDCEDYCSFYGAARRLLCSPDVNS